MVPKCSQIAHGVVLCHHKHEGVGAKHTAVKFVLHYTVVGSFPIITIGHFVKVQPLGDLNIFSNKISIRIFNTLLAPVYCDHQHTIRK